MIPDLPKAPSLPKLDATSAAAATNGFKPQPASQALLKPNQTSSEYLHALEQKKMSGDSIQVLSHGMPERESVHYACQSSQKVASQMAPADKKALESAQAWVKNPNATTQANAAAAAAKTDYKGPGAWAAQAAAWTKTPAGTGPAAGLTGHASAGSVQLAAAMAKTPQAPLAPALKTPQQPAAPKLEAPQSAAPKSPQAQPPQAPQQPQLTPPQQEELAKAHQPFIDLGKEIASGKNTWT